jgi:hypothetical protein
MKANGMHALSMALGIVLEKNKDWTGGETRGNVQLSFRRTPCNRDITSISSLFKYGIRKNEDGFLMLILTLSSPQTATPRPNFQPWSFSFSLTTSQQLPETAIYIATSQIFSRIEPDAKARENKRLPSYPRSRPEYRMQSIRQLKPLSLLNLGSEYYTVIDTGTDRWHRLIAVGYRYMDSALQGSRDDQIDLDKEGSDEAYGIPNKNREIQRAHI